MLDILVIVLMSLSAIFLLVRYLLRLPAKHKSLLLLSDNYKSILETDVPFYKQLSVADKLKFESRVKQFIDGVRITGVNAEPTDLDRVLVAASAIIPIFAFDNWEYPNLNEVLLYPETFGENFEPGGKERSILGMVGTGPLQNTMILSQHELRQGFLNRTGKNNTAIHEFVHLVDKTDGATDGIPENLMDKRYILPWLDLMQKNIAEIIKGKTDINPYGATSQAEFFAVVSEYFFERPDLLRQKHPELYNLLEEIFQAPRTLARP